MNIRSLVLPPRNMLFRQFKNSLKCRHILKSNLWSIKKIIYWISLMYLHVFVCMFVFMWILWMYMWVQNLLHEHADKREMSTAITLIFFFFWPWDRVCHWTGISSFCLGWVVTKFQGSTCLHPDSHTYFSCDIRYLNSGSHVFKSSSATDWTIT